MNREPVKRIIAILEKVEDGDFYIRTFAKCALGHAARDPWFIAQGFILDYVQQSVSDHIMMDIFGAKIESLWHIFGLEFNEPEDNTVKFYGAELADITPAMVIAKLKNLLGIYE